jgi:NAD(P)-dependent dehydrogenase (short-subunit alcohol dehydrogenase family)
MDVTVLGAAEGAGQAITAELAAAGHDVTAVTRGGTTPASARITPAVAEIVNGLLPEPVKVSRIDPTMLAVAAVFSRECRKVAHQLDRPWVVDTTAFETAFGRIQVTEHDTALRQTLAWQQATAASERA